MPKSVFDWRQQPYYICVMIFDGFAAFTSLMMNTVTTGHESQFYLLLTALFVGLVIWSLLYLIHCSKGGDEDADMSLSGLPLGKNLYYIAILCGCAWRLYSGYEMNTDSTGIESIYGAIWALTSPVLILYTWGNYRSYMARQAATGAAPKPTR